MNRTESDLIAAMGQRSGNHLVSGQSTVLYLTQLPTKLANLTPLQTIPAILIWKKLWIESKYVLIV